MYSAEYPFAGESPRADCNFALNGMIAITERVQLRVIYRKNTHLLIIGQLAEYKRRCGKCGHTANGKIKPVQTCGKHHYNKHKKIYKSRAEITLQHYKDKNDTEMNT